ncbi:MAG: HK97 family phage prohead protease [bacterium]
MRFASIEGYAAIFGERDLNGDIIRAGAFGKKLIPAQHRNDTILPIRMLYQHAVDRPVGVWREMKEDGRGLFVRGDLILDAPDSASIHGLLRGQALNGLSIGFRPIKAKNIQGGRELTEIDLWEISIVTFPMAPKARITKVGAPATLNDRLRRAAGTLSR